MLPKKVLIGNVPYKIKVVEGLVKDGNKEYWGQIEYLKQIITMSDQLETEAFVKILLHEITHGILQEYGMSKHNKEDFVDRLSAALYDFLARNDLSFLQSESKIDKTRNDPFDSIQYAIIKATPDAVDAVDAVYKQVPLSSAPSSESDDTELKARSRKLPINNERNLSVKIGELKDVKFPEPKVLEEPEFWKTGIKIIDDDEHYKTRYECPECGNKGTRYLPEDYQYVICHNCEKEFQKIPATIEGFPHRDSWGNYFIAGEVQQYGNGEKA